MIQLFGNTMAPNFRSHSWQMIGFHQLDGMSNAFLPEQCSTPCVVCSVMPGLQRFPTMDYDNLNTRHTG